MKCNSLVCCSLAAYLLFSPGCGNSPLSLNGQKQREGLTFADLHEKGMINYVGKEFVLNSKFEWHYSTKQIPEDPTPTEEFQKKAGQLYVPFGHIPNLPVVKTTKAIGVFSTQLKKVKDKSDKEIYAFGKTTLTNNDKVYSLKVKLLFRKDYPEEVLQNPDFIKECNSPTYWAQKYKLEILEIR